MKKDFYFIVSKSSPKAPYILAFSFIMVSLVIIRPRSEYGLYNYDFYIKAVSKVL